MKITPSQYAKSLYELTVEKSEQEIDSVVSNFIKVLAKSNQVKNISRIIEKFQEIWNKENGIVEAEIVSREKLNGDSLEKVKSFVKEKYQAKEVILNNVVDEKIKGGIVVKVGDEVMDGSVSKQLQDLRYRLQK